MIYSYSAITLSFGFSRHRIIAWKLPVVVVVVGLVKNFFKIGHIHTPHTHSPASQPTENPKRHQTSNNNNNNKKSYLSKTDVLDWLSLKKMVNGLNG